MKAKHLFAVMCAVMMGFSVAINNKEEVKKADADVVEKSLTIFENGSFYDDGAHSGGSSITDGNWCNSGSWATSIVTLNSVIDLSSYEKINITYTNTGTSAAWIQFGMGNINGNEYDFFQTGKSFAISEKSNVITIDMSLFTSATSLSCIQNETKVENKHQGISLDMTKIQGFSMQGDNVVSVSKIVVTKNVTIDVTSKEIAILKDGKTYSSFDSTKGIVSSNLTDGIWANNAAWAHSRIIFDTPLDLTYFETIEIKYTATATATWAKSGEFGIGNKGGEGTTFEYDYVAITKDIDVTGAEATMVLNIADYLTTNVTCTWTDDHSDTLLDVSKIQGISVKAGAINLNITSIIAKSSLLSLVEKLDTFNLCDATIEQIQAMIEEYNLVLTKNPNASNYQLDENTTLAQRMDYMEMILNKKAANSSQTVGSGVVIQTNKTGKESLIALIAILGILSVSAYYFIEKRKVSNK